MPGLRVYARRAMASASLLHPAPADLFQLGGRPELLPATGFSLFGGWSIERRIVRAASRLAGTARGEDAAFGTWLRAGERIESLIDLIDPELCQLVA